MDTVIYEPTVNRAKSIGRGTKIGAFCDIGKDVIIGANCNIQCHVGISNGTVIGDNVFISAYVVVLNDKYMDGTITPVKIGNNVKIGGSCVIFPNVIIGDGAFIGAGCIVHKDVPAGKVLLGNPARIIGDVSGLKKNYE